MLGVTRSRGHRQYIRRRGQKREVSNRGNGSAASVRLLVLCAALASAVGGGGQGRVTAISSGHRPGILGLGFGREKAPAVPEPLSLADRVRRLGERVRTGGVTGLATGNGGGSANGGAKAGAKTMAAAQVRSEGQQTPTDRSNGKNSFIAGGLAGSISMTITCPIEVVKTQLQGSAVKHGSNAFSIASSIFKSDGPRGFFRGLPPGLAGIIPARSTYFFAYSRSKDFWTNNARLGDRHRDLTEVLCGVTAGVVQNTITNPIWMVKTRMQLLADTATGQVAYGGYKEAIGAIYRDEGVRGFYKGMSASYWGCSEGCLYFVLYERIKRRLRRHHNEGRAEKGLPPTDSLPPAYLFASSAFSKMCATIATYPHEVMRTRLREQARNGVYKYTGMWQSLVLVAKEEGRRGLYAGMGTHVARVVPNMAIMMLSYELISDWLRRRDERNAQGFNNLLKSPAA
ncbi:unnamed protein product [Ectocarpus sp. 12 AP-2014]